MRDYVNSTALQEYTTKLVAKLKTLFPGTPTAAATVSDMTDHSKTYVYVGSESGYTAGDWYYWNGTAWTSGGPFQATSIITDTTLAVAGEAADAKATGDAIAAAKAAVLNAMAPAYSPSATYAVGAYVNHNGAIYRCTTAITTAEAWTTGHWAAVPLGADLEGQVSDLKTQISDVTGVSELIFSDGYIPLVYKGADATTTPTSSAGYSYIVDACKKGDKYTAWVTPGTYSGSRTAMFLDSDKKCLTRIEGATNLVGITLVAPANGYFVINANSAYLHKVYKGGIDITGILDEVKAKANNLYLSDSRFENLTSTIESNKVYSTTDPSGTVLNNYSADTYTVNAGDIIEIICAIPSSDKYKTALFYDSSGNLIGFIEPNRDEATQDIICTVPNKAVKMIISHATATTCIVKKHHHIDNKRKISYIDDVLTITDDCYKFVMKKRGNNNLFELFSISKPDGTLIYQFSSDLMGPYVVRALENADGDDQRATYTGGNHAYDYPKGTSGTPTAETTAIHIFVDGDEITNGTEMNWNGEITVSWENEVQAWNTRKADGTGRAVLKEHPSYSFKGNGCVDVNNYIEALEDIVITLYYGLQLQALWMDKGVYIPSATRKITDMSVFTDDGEGHLGQFFTGTEITGFDTDVIIKMEFNSDIDLGNGNAIDPTHDGLRLHANTSKIYTVMIWSDFELAENEYATFNGYYKFIKPESLIGEPN